MKISIIQMDIIFKENEKNLKKMKVLLKTAMKDSPDTIILPETWNTGFFPKDNIVNYAEKNGEISKKFFSEFAFKNNVNIIAGSIINRRENKIYNTSFIFNRKGENIDFYDKIHLFSPMNEDKYFESGKK